MIFNRSAIICTALMFAVLAALLVGLHFTEADPAKCQAIQSADVCFLTLNP